MSFLKRNILFVDDDPMACTLIESMLTQAGYTVTCAADGFEGVDMLHKYPFDLLILDVMMTRMNGLEMLKRVKTQPETRDIPVLMLSSRDDQKVISRALSMGALDYMIKPPARDILLKKIETILGSRPRFAEVNLAATSSKAHCEFVFQGRILSIGEAGMTISCPMRLEPGSFNRIDAEVFKEIGITTPTFKVVHCQEDKSRFMIYTNFIGLKTQEIAAIREWVVTQALRGRVVA